MIKSSLMFKLRPHQSEKSKLITQVLKRYKLAILNGETRSGKTLTALEVAKYYNNVLFVTKKKAIQSIESDYKMAGYTFKITVINYESLHKVMGVFDLVIADESHCISAMPRPSKRTKELQKRCSNDVLIMTGTLVPESNSQIYHQLWISKFSPFNNFKNFYAWFNHFGTPNVIYTTYGQSKCYKTSKWNEILPFISPILVTMTKKEANFKSEVQEHFHTVEVGTSKLIHRIFKDRVIEGKDEVILADTPAKLMQKVHQLASGTIKFESGNTMVICDNKAKYIKETFKGKKAIFYKFIAELEAIKKHLDITQDITEFNTTNKDIALQFVSGREGTNLSKAENLIMYNVDHSAVSYFQSRDRMTVKDREENNIHWIFDSGGHCQKVYDAVMGKKNYTLQSFRKDYGVSK